MQRILCLKHRYEIEMEICYASNGEPSSNILWIITCPLGIKQILYSHIESNNNNNEQQAKCFSLFISEPVNAINKIQYQTIVLF